MFLIDISPDEHNRFTVEIGTELGMPAASAAEREIYKGEGGWHVPVRRRIHTPISMEEAQVTKPIADLRIYHLSYWDPVRFSEAWTNPDSVNIL